MNTKHIDDIVATFATDTGVAESDVKKVLERLGLNNLESEAARLVQPDQISSLGPNDFKLSMKVAHIMVHS